MSQNFRRDERGLTLVELIVAIAIGGLFLGMLAGLFANGFIAQQQAAARDKATGWATVVTASLAASLRNATADVTVIHSGRGVVARVIGRDGDWSCRSWLVDDAGNVRYLDNGHTQISSAAVAEGALLVRGSKDPVTGEGDGAEGAFEERAERTIAIDLSFSIGEVTVPLSDAVTTQGTLKEEAGSCWSES